MDDAARAMTAGEAGREGPERISPLFNDLFLRLLGSQESKGVTRSLVNAVLRLAGAPAVGDVRELRCDVTSAGGIAMRSPRVDVLVVSDDGAVVDLEAQRERVNVDNKVLFYASKLLCEHTPKGGPRDYSRLPQVIVIMLVEGWARFGGQAFLHVGRVRWKSEDGIEDGSDRVLHVVAELDKVAKRYTVDDEKLATDEGLAWLYFLAKGYREDDMEEVMRCFPDIREFAEHYKIALGDPDLKRTYERYCEARTEYNDIIREAKLWARGEGRKQGLEDGRKQGLEDGRKQGLEDGRKQGLEDGRKQGAEANLLENARSIMEALHFTAQQALDLLKVPEADQPHLMELL